MAAVMMFVMEERVVSDSMAEELAAVYVGTGTRVTDVG